MIATLFCLWVNKLVRGLLKENPLKIIKVLNFCKFQKEPLKTWHLDKTVAILKVGLMKICFIKYEKINL